MTGRAVVLQDLIDVTAATLVVIHDVWVGFNPHSPVAAHYVLSRSGEQLVGEGRLSTSLSGERVVPVALPAAATASFLGAMGRLRLSSRPYEPRLSHTDDYPEVEIAFHVRATEIDRTGGLVLLHTTSQGRFHDPWAAFVGGRSYVVSGRGPGRALWALRGLLRLDELEQMAAGG